LLYLWHGPQGHHDSAAWAAKKRDLSKLLCRRGVINRQDRNSRQHWSFLHATQTMLETQVHATQTMFDTHVDATQTTLETHTHASHAHEHGHQSQQSL
jgi:hypothetical protein